MNIAALQSLVMPAHLLSSSRAEWETASCRHKAEKEKTARSKAVSRERARVACVKARRAEWQAASRRHKAEKEKTARSEAVSRERARVACVKARRAEWEAELLHALRLPHSPLAFFLVRNFTPYIHRGRLLWLQLFKPFNRYPSTVFSCPC